MGRRRILSMISSPFRGLVGSCPFGPDWADFVNHVYPTLIFLPFDPLPSTWIESGTGRQLLKSYVQVVFCTSVSSTQLIVSKWTSFLQRCKYWILILNTSFTFVKGELSSVDGGGTSRLNLKSTLS